MRFFIELIFICVLLFMLYITSSAPMYKDLPLPPLEMSEEVKDISCELYGLGYDLDMQEMMQKNILENIEK